MKASIFLPNSAHYPKDNDMLMSIFEKDTALSYRYYLFNPDSETIIHAKNEKELHDIVPDKNDPNPMMTLMNSGWTKIYSPANGRNAKIEGTDHNTIHKAVKWFHETTNTPALFIIKRKDEDTADIYYINNEDETLSLFINTGELKYMSLVN